MTREGPSQHHLDAADNVSSLCSSWVMRSGRTPSDGPYKRTGVSVYCKFAMTLTSSSNDMAALLGGPTAFNGLAAISPHVLTRSSLPSDISWAQAIARGAAWEEWGHPRET